MKIGCIQFSPTLGDLTTTITDLETLFPQSQGADLIVLPELCNSGYNFADRQQAWDTSEPIAESRFLAFLQEKSLQLGTAIITGFNERDGDDLYNSAVLINHGKIIGKYQKLHLFYREKDFFKSGTTGLPIFEVSGINIGIQICFDWMFPEAWRVLALKGADIICHPSNLVLPGMAQRAVPIHAMINRIFTITANRTGSEGNLSFTGASTIANPKGDVLAQASPNSAQVLTVEINPSQAQNKNITEKNHIFKDRQPQEYQSLTDNPAQQLG